MIRLRLATALLLAAAPVPALAQSKPQTIDQRVDKVEKELRAVQRKVFPGGPPAFFEPEIAAPAAQAGGIPASTPLAELTARVDALEKTVASLTGQIEQDEHRVAQIAQEAKRDRAEFDARIKALEAAALAAAPVPVAPPLAVPVAPPPVRAERPPVTAPTKPATTPRGTKAAPPPAATEEDAPPATTASGDPGEDAYMAAYRFWEQKKYPEARAALKAYVAKYPKHRRASYAQNLIGRAYLEEGSPALAAEAFVANYQGNPRGERAQDSLYYLGQSLTKLNRNADACKVYDEIDAAYADKVSDSLKPRIAAARKDAKCK